MRFYFIRHAESENNARAKGAPRIPDAPLTERGRQQASHTANFLVQKPDPFTSWEDSSERLNSHGVTRLISSPTWRTLETAAPIADACGLKIEVWQDLYELGGTYTKEGEKFIGLPGKTRSEIMATFPSCVLPESITDVGWYNREYETWDAGLRRAQRVVAKLRELMPSHDVVAIVTHQVFFNLSSSQFGQIQS
jgi:2,3-bisphosphoglycerate-dependent phosphoglycerate mutase